MVTSFKRSHECTATLSAPNPAAGHHRPSSLLETLGHSQASLGPSLVGSLLLFLGPGVHKVLIVPSKRHSNTVLSQSPWGLWVLFRTRNV